MIHSMRAASLMCVFLMAQAPILSAADKDDKKEEKKIDPATKSVVKAIKKLFPKGEVMSLSKKRVKNLRRFEAVVKDDDGEHTLLLRPNGSVVERKDPITDEKKLPGPVAKAVKKKYPKGKFVSAQKIEKYKKFSYEVVVDQGGEKTMILGADGKKIKKKDLNKVP